MCLCTYDKFIWVFSRELSTSMGLKLPGRKALQCMYIISTFLHWRDNDEVKNKNLNFPLH